jgi:hypothetical protein
MRHIYQNICAIGHPKQYFKIWIRIQENFLKIKQNADIHVLKKKVPKLNGIYGTVRMQIMILYPSRIKGSKRHQIPDPDPQHC